MTSDDYDSNGEPVPEGLADRWDRQAVRSLDANGNYRDSYNEGMHDCFDQCADDLTDATESLAKKWEREADRLSDAGPGSGSKADALREAAAELRAVMVGGGKDA